MRVADGGECPYCWADRDVVHSDGLLIANRYGLLLQRVNVRNTINEWNQEVQTGRQDTMKLTEPLNHPRRLLRHDTDAVVDGCA